MIDEMAGRAQHSPSTVKSLLYLVLEALRGTPGRAPHEPGSHSRAKQLLAQERVEGISQAADWLTAHCARLHALRRVSRAQTE